MNIHLFLGFPEDNAVMCIYIFQIRLNSATQTWKELFRSFVV